MSMVKALRFPVAIHAAEDELVVTAPCKTKLSVVTGAAERVGAIDQWSAEELFVASVGASYARTLAAVAERFGLELDLLDVDAVGHVSIRADGEYGFVAIELNVTADAGPHAPERLFQATELARHHARVAQAVDVPLRIRVKQPESRLAMELEGAPV